MKRTHTYLSKTAKDGWYGYRRRVPPDLVPVIQKREWVFSYNTKKRSEAIAAHQRKHLDVEREIEAARKLLKSKDQRGVADFKVVYKRLQADGLLPTQRLRLADDHPAQFMKLCSEYAEVSEAHSLYQADVISSDELELRLTSITTPDAKRLIDYLFLKDEVELQLEMANWDSNDHGFPVEVRPDVLPVHLKELDITKRILDGDIFEFEANLEGALGLYINSTKKKRRNPEQQLKLERDITSLVGLIAKAMPLRMKTPLDELDPDIIEDVLSQEKLKSSTRRRSYAALSPLITVWNLGRAPKEQVADPFAVLKRAIDPIAVSEEKTKRKIWSAAEVKHFEDSLRATGDLELLLIGLLMVYAGKPQGETSGLKRDDLVLKAEPPHLCYRNNELRIFGKGRLENIIPLVGGILDDFKAYIANFDGGKDDPLFPSAFRTKSGDLSKKFKSHMQEYDPVLGEQFTPYGLRHTFKVRANKAGVSREIIAYIHGHNEIGSKEFGRKISEAYAENHISRELKDDLTTALGKIDAVKSWELRTTFSDF